MKRILFLLIFAALAAPWALAQEPDTAWRGVDNTFLYERYAQRPGLNVAQLLHYPIGKGVFVNGLMIHPDDSVSWHSLCSEFHSREMWAEMVADSRKQSSVGMSIALGERNEPTRLVDSAAGSLEWYKTCAVIIDHPSRTIWIFHYSTQHEFDCFMRRVNAVVKKRSAELLADERNTD